MNSKQRRQAQRKTIRQVRIIWVLINDLLDDLESGKETLVSARKGLAEFTELLNEIERDRSRQPVTEMEWDCTDYAEEAKQESWQTTRRP